MRKLQITNYKLQILCFFVLVLSFIIYNSSFIIPLYAASPAPLVSDNPQYATDSVKVLEKPVQVLGEQASSGGILSQSVDQKLQELQKEIASKAAQLKADVNKKIDNKAILCTVSIITDDSISLDSKSGNRKIKINEYTVFQNEQAPVGSHSDSKQKTKKAFSKDLIQSGDTLVCLGDIDETGAMRAKNVVKIDPPTPQSYTYLLGEINVVKDLTFVLELRQKQTVNLNFSATTFIQNGKDEGVIGDIKQGKQEVVILKPPTEASQSAFIYLVPEISLMKTSK